MILVFLFIFSCYSGNSYAQDCVEEYEIKERKNFSLNLQNNTCDCPYFGFYHLKTMTEIQHLEEIAKNDSETQKLILKHIINHGYGNIDMKDWIVADDDSHSILYLAGALGTSLKEWNRFLNDEVLHSALQNGDPLAQYIWGQFRGIIHNSPLIDSLSCLRLAADKNFTPALFSFSTLTEDNLRVLHTGGGERGNASEYVSHVRSLLKKSAEQGHVLAAYEYGKKAYSPHKNTSLSFKWLRFAGDQGFVKAQKELKIIFKPEKKVKGEDDREHLHTLRNRIMSLRRWHEFQVSLQTSNPCRLQEINKMGLFCNFLDAVYLKLKKHEGGFMNGSMKNPFHQGGEEEGCLRFYDHPDLKGLNCVGEENVKLGDQLQKSFLSAHKEKKDHQEENEGFTFSSYCSHMEKECSDLEGRLQKASHDLDDFDTSYRCLISDSTPLWSSVQNSTKSTEMKWDNEEFKKIHEMKIKKTAFNIALKKQEISEMKNHLGRAKDVVMDAKKMQALIIKAIEAGQQKRSQNLEKQISWLFS